MPVFLIDQLDDPRVAPYRDLPDSRQQPSNDSFVVEGERLVRRLLGAGIQPRSILLEPRQVDRLSSVLHPDMTLLVCPRELLRQIVGFRFHRGLLACAPRPANPTCQELAENLPPRATVVICNGVQDPENLGGILRTCAAFAIGGVIAGKPSCDFFSRRVLRVSIGSVFRLTVRASDNLLEDLEYLRTTAGCQLVGSVVQDNAEPLGTCTSRPARIALVLGSESEGLSEDVLAACDRRVTIPLPGGIDSLNVSVAAGLLLHGLQGQTASRTPDPFSPHR